MNKVKVLIEGYARTSKDGSYLASPTTTLVESNGHKFIVDPGTNEGKLRAAFKENKIKYSDIEFIYLSHWHPDHFLNIRLFPSLDVYDGEICWRGQKEIAHNGKLPGVNGVEILKTPGHAPEHSCLLINTKEGHIAIAADVIWWQDGEQKINTKEEILKHKDPFAYDEKELLKSRKLVLSKADYIIPGHGKMFKVTN